MKVICSRFAVDENAFCVWDLDLEQKNKEFIQDFNTKFFDFLSGMYHNHWENENNEKAKQYLSFMIRTSYSHALESLFSLMCATIQAPDCVYGWLNKYRITDLRNLVLKIKNKQPIYTKLNLENISFISISDLFHPFDIKDKKKNRLMKKKFADLWLRYANDFLDEKISKEYNNIKHGFRAKNGGFEITISSDKKFTDSKVHSFGGSKYGSTFFSLEKIGESNTNSTVLRNFQNWEPLNFMYALQSISWSISNIIAFLKLILKFDKSSVKFVGPSDLESFNEPFKRVVKVSNASIKEEFKIDQMRILSKDEILSVYKKNT